ncbi:MAG: GGDEF domain-containing protein [Acidobacteriota bacterium]|nr:GGDEF domain-containing protein [Acidobacteriota bacterium]
MAELIEKETNPYSGLLRELKRFVEAGKAGRLDVAFNLRGLSEEETEALRLISEAIGHYRKTAAYKYDFRDMAKMEERIKWLKSEAEKAYYDSLTNIYNRRYFDENINHVISALSRSGSILSLMMIDIDHFKQYNDTYGHDEGDKCLCVVAETIAKSIARANDFAARYGGEEFVVVLPNTDETGARQIADNMLENVRKLCIPHQNNTAADRVTVSIGVTTGIAKHTQSAEDYVRQADKSLYASKQNGRNRYKFVALED